MSQSITNFMPNYQSSKPPPPKKKKSEEEKEKTRKEYIKIRVRSYQPSWEKTFPWLELHVINKESKMICKICKRYESSGPFALGATKFKKDVVKGHNDSKSHKENVRRLRNITFGGPADRFLEDINQADILFQNSD